MGSGGNGLDGLRLLVVDDNYYVREVVRRILYRAGAEVYVAEDAEQALKIARDPSLGIDLMITDVEMPGMSGPELVPKVREIRPGLRVLYISGSFRRLGMDDCAMESEDTQLEKPFDSETLRSAVKAIVVKTGSELH